jgi:hypothetical protein
MAEDDVIDGVVTVLYGDAPGTDIQKEHKEALRHYNCACDAVTNLKLSHLLQLETCDTHEELLSLLFGSLCVCFGEEVSDESMQLIQKDSPALPQRITKMDINKVKLATINGLRPYISDPLFVPEKLFAVNRAAGTLCA